jgi:excisionase family DNA binding protein
LQFNIKISSSLAGNLSDRGSQVECNMEDTPSKVTGSIIYSDVMTVHDLALYLKMSDAKIYRMARSGMLPVIRIGKTWRFKKDMVDNWLMQHSNFVFEPL